jgi:hypothetical protein
MKMQTNISLVFSTTSHRPAGGGRVAHRFNEARLDAEAAFVPLRFAPIFF